MCVGASEDVPGTKDAPQESAADEGTGCGGVVLREVGLCAVRGRDLLLLGGRRLVAAGESVVVDSKDSPESARGAGTGGEGVDVGVRV